MWKIVTKGVGTLLNADHIFKEVLDNFTINLTEAYLRATPGVIDLLAFENQLHEKKLVNVNLSFL